MDPRFNSLFINENLRLLRIPPGSNNKNIKITKIKIEILKYGFRFFLSSITPTIKKTVDIIKISKLINALLTLNKFIFCKMKKNIKFTNTNTPPTYGVGVE